MKKTLSLLILTSLLTVRAADVSGVITFKGTAPEEGDIGPKMTESSPDCAALYDPARLPTTHFFAVSAKGELADVVVVVKGVSGKFSGTNAAPLVLDQKKCVYFPQIFTLQTGQKLLVRNSDPCVHNVHTVPKENEMKNLPQFPGSPDLEFVFDKPEPFLKFQCDSHPWMFAWVTVVDHPYFAVSGADGKFSIKNVPPGKYTLEATHRKLGVQTAEIEVKADGTTQNFSFAPK